jgi:hypothetical protein
MKARLISGDTTGDEEGAVGHAAAKEITGNRICKLLQTVAVEGLVFHRRLSFASQELTHR